MLDSQYLKFLCSVCKACVSDNDVFTPPELNKIITPINRHIPSTITGNSEAEFFKLDEGEVFLDTIKVL
jgi:hypothetical protein